MFVFGIAALIPLVFSFQKASYIHHCSCRLQMRNSHTLPIQAACHGKMNYQWRVYFLITKINIYEKFTITNMHFLYLYLLNSQEIWWLKWKVRLLQYVSFFQVSVNALTSECMLSNLAIATSLLRERMYSLMVSMLICWSDAQDGGARISINIQFPHCFVIYIYIYIFPFIESGHFVFEFTVREFLKFREKNLQRRIRFVWAKSIVTFLPKNKKQ